MEALCMRGVCLDVALDKRQLALRVDENHRLCAGSVRPIGVTEPRWRNENAFSEILSGLGCHG